MPEGHTIHRLAARHRELFAGERLAVSSPQGRFAAGAALVDGSRLRDTEAYGKHLLHHYEGDRIVHVHLGLYGQFTDGEPPPPAPVGQVRMRLVSGAHWLDLRGPAACEVLDPARDAARCGTGSAPIRCATTPTRRPAYARIRRSAKPLFALLLDQSVVAGCGLIYVNEVLFRAGLPPTTPGRQIGPDVLGRALGRPARADEGRGGARPDRHRPHRAHAGGDAAARRGWTGTAARCTSTAGPGSRAWSAAPAIARGPLAGRNLYWCPTCQPATR